MHLYCFTVISAPALSLSVLFWYKQLDPNQIWPCVCIMYSHAFMLKIPLREKNFPFFAMRGAGTPNERNTHTFAAGYFTWNMYKATFPQSNTDVLTHNQHCMGSNKQLQKCHMTHHTCPLLTSTYTCYILSFLSCPYSHKTKPINFSIKQVSKAASHIWSWAHNLIWNLEAPKFKPFFSETFWFVYI